MWKARLSSWATVCSFKLLLTAVASAALAAATATPEQAKAGKFSGFQPCADKSSYGASSARAQCATGKLVGLAEPCDSLVDAAVRGDLAVKGRVDKTAIAFRPVDFNIASKPAYDLVISDGRVIDPESRLDAVRNVGIRNGSIVAMTAEALKGKVEIDAAGLIVAPGFIDLHAHDHNPITYRLHAQDGVTTALELERGVFPVKSWYAQRENRAPINFGASVSHAVVRSIVFGAVDIGKLSGDPAEDEKLLDEKIDWMQRESTSEQREKMTALLRQGLQEGGLGFGFHLAVTPGAGRDEMLGFYALSARQGVTNFVHVRSLGQVMPIEAGKEVVYAAEITGASIHVVHINSSGLWETADLLKMFQRARKKGLDISTEVYPYTGAQSSLDDPRATQRLELFRADYSDLELVATGERLTKARFDYHRQRTPRGSLIAHIMDQADIDAAVEHPMAMIASDGGDYIDGRGHPRGAGAFARIFRHYVRERKKLTLMQALVKVSLMPAQRLENMAPQMKMRGRLQVGKVADITVFDAAKIADQATYAEPMRPSAGIAHVIVNGEFVVKDYRYQEGVYPGQAIRKTEDR